MGLLHTARGYFSKRVASTGSAKTPKLSFDRPNTPQEWEREYLRPITPVTELRNPVATVLAGLTKHGDTLMEAGCGSGELSAELAIAGRSIVLLDFSKPILKRALQVFEASRLSPPKIVACDLMVHPLPFSDESVDWVWSSGVLEHWTDEELIPLVTEMARIARKGVISLVPSSRCVFYRWGKAIAESQAEWPYGREIPRESLYSVFHHAGLDSIVETDCWPEHAPAFLSMTGIPTIEKKATEWWRQLASDDPAKKGQGYLLLTIGRRSA